MLDCTRLIEEADCVRQALRGMKEVSEEMSGHTLMIFFHVSFVLNDLEDSFYLDEMGVLGPEELVLLQLRLICEGKLTAEEAAYGRFLTERITLNESLPLEDIQALARILTLLTISFDRGHDLELDYLRI